MTALKKKTAPEAAEAWRLYTSPGDAWAAMYEDCAAAARSIVMEQYIFRNDETGRKFLKLFIEKAGAGVEVRLCCDEVGSESLKSSPLLDKLRQSGGVVKFYNAPKWIDFVKPQKLFPRTHLKVLVVDSGIVHIGGVCIAQQMKAWRDTQIRVEGTVAREVKAALDRNSRGKPKRNSRRFFRRDRGNRLFTYVQNDPALFLHPLLGVMLRRIGEARDHIYITAAYFVPPWRLRHQLRRAAKRGVKVVILCPETSDVKIADWASLSFAPRLLRAGVRIFHYRKTMLHAKTAVIDGAWGTVGSCNMDSLSLFHNREGNLLIKDKDALAQLTRDFMRDLADSRELTLAGMKRIPLWKRVAMHFARLLRPAL